MKKILTALAALWTDLVINPDEYALRALEQFK